MNRRIKIYRIEVLSTDKLLQQIFHLPKDCKRVSAIQATVSIKAEPAGSEFDILMGYARLKANGIFLYEQPVFFSGRQPTTGMIPTPGTLETGLTFQSGKKQLPVALMLSDELKNIELSYQPADTSYNYVLSIYLYYECKEAGK